MKESRLYLSLGFVCLIASFFVTDDTLTICGVICFATSAILNKLDELK